MGDPPATAHDPEDRVSNPILTSPQSRLKLCAAAPLVAILLACSPHAGDKAPAATPLAHSASGVASPASGSALAPKQWDDTGEDVVQEARAQHGGFDTQLAHQLGFEFSAQGSGCEMKAKALNLPEAPRQMWAIASLGPQCDKRGGQWLQIVTRERHSSQQDIFNAGASFARLGQLATMLVQPKHLQNGMPDLSLGFDSRTHGRIWQRYAYDGRHYVLLDESPKFQLDAPSAQTMVFGGEGGEAFAALPARVGMPDKDGAKYAGRLLPARDGAPALWITTCMSDACSGNWGSAMSVLMDGPQAKPVLKVDYANWIGLDWAFVSHGLPRAYIAYQSGAMEEYEFDGQAYQVKAWR